MRPCSQALYDQGRESLAWLFTWRKETNDYLNILIKQGTSQYQRKKSELYCLSIESFWEKTTNKISTSHAHPFQKGQATKSLLIDYTLQSVFYWNTFSSVIEDCIPPQFSVKSISAIYCHLLEDRHGCSSKCDQNVRWPATHRSQHGEGTGLDDGSCPLQVRRTEPTARPARYWSFQLGESIQGKIVVSYILASRKLCWLGYFSRSSNF